MCTCGCSIFPTAAGPIVPVQVERFSPSYFLHAAARCRADAVTSPCASGGCFALPVIIFLARVAFRRARLADRQEKKRFGGMWNCLSARAMTCRSFSSSQAHMFRSQDSVLKAEARRDL